MPLTEQQRRLVSGMAKAGELRPIELGRLEALRRFANPDTEDLQAIDAALKIKKG